MGGLFGREGRGRWAARKRERWAEERLYYKMNWTSTWQKSFYDSWK
jgi:hypothetical protein